MMVIGFGLLFRTHEFTDAWVYHVLDILRGKKSPCGHQQSIPCLSGDFLVSALRVFDTYLLVFFVLGIDPHMN